MPISFAQKRMIENMLLFITEENDTLFLLVSSIYLGNILAWCKLIIDNLLKIKTILNIMLTLMP